MSTRKYIVYILFHFSFLLITLMSIFLSPLYAQSISLDSIKDPSFEEDKGQDVLEVVRNKNFTLALRLMQEGQPFEQIEILNLESLKINAHFLCLCQKKIINGVSLSAI